MDNLYYYQVVFHLPGDRCYIYKSSLADLIGKRVRVSLGAREVVGYVLEKTEDIPPLEIKYIDEVVDKEVLLARDQLEFAKWISFYYLCSLGEALALFFSFKKNKLRPVSSEDQTREGESLKKIVLTEIQEKIYQQYLKGNKNLPFLLHGITGSGKTFFYLKLIEQTLDQNQQALVLVPEIALTFQLYQTCCDYFNESEIAIYHSKLPDSLRQKIRQEVSSKRIKIVISTRSGLFLNYSNLGLLVIDEEHESSYKSNSTPRYEVRRVGYFLSHLKKIPLLYVSATPSVELYHWVQAGKINLLQLNSRYKNFALIENKILDNPKHETILEEIQRKIFLVLKNQKQVIIYINQRGFSSSIICNSCDCYEECPNCDITVTFHKKKNLLLCHYCGYSNPFVDKCSKCESKNLSFIKLGTEYMDEFLKKRFLDYRIERFDSDAVYSTKEIKKKLQLFQQGKIDVLVGTQMLIKGHDFKRVALVVVLDPEKYLLFPDYRSNEKCFSHLVQVSGRAGRYELSSSDNLERNQSIPGEMLIQTNLREHYAIQAAQTQDYQQFYLQEILYREKFLYPPFVRLVRFIIRGSKQERVIQEANRIKNLFEKTLKKIIILGPAPCMIERQRNYYRWNVVLKIKKMKLFLIEMQNLKNQLGNHFTYVEIDIDPVSLF